MPGKKQDSEWANEQLREYRELCKKTPEELALQVRDLERKIGIYIERLQYHDHLQEEFMKTKIELYQIKGQVSEKEKVVGQTLGSILAKIGEKETVEMKAIDLIKHEVHNTLQSIDDKIISEVMVKLTALDKIPELLLDAFKELVQKELDNKK